MLLLASASPASTAPVLVLIASVVLIVAAIAFGRLHAFFALILAAVFVALAARVGPAAQGDFAGAVENVMAEFGGAAGKIGYTIVVAAVIGAALLASGAAEQIVRGLIRWVGEQRAPLALMVASFVLGIPVFFDTVFFLLVPLARTLSTHLGRNYVLHLLAICAGGVITHATVPPTPGPLAAAEILHVELGTAIVAGFALGILPALVGLGFARWRNRRMRLPVPAAPAANEQPAPTGWSATAGLPGFTASIAPIVLPVLLIGAASVVRVWPDGLPAWGVNLVALLGNKNVALSLGAAWAVAVYLRQRRCGWRDASAFFGEPVATAGVIILITAAGGAYGAMLQNSGIGEVVSGWSGRGAGDRVLLAWVLAAILRIAQGSTTVAMVTSAGILASLGDTPLAGADAVCTLLATGYGALSVSWMNDSGFWIFSRMSGLTESQTLRSWTPLIAVISVVGLVELLLVSHLLPLLFSTS